jgi:hypothetical protein
MRADKDGGRSSATPKERPPVPHQSEARGARPSIGSPFRGTAEEKAGAFSQRYSWISVDNYFSHDVYPTPKAAIGQR